ncbi:hypothetical protein GCM10027027_20950 [Neomicrococcus lactis]
MLPCAWFTVIFPESAEVAEADWLEFELFDSVEVAACGAPHAVSANSAVAARVAMERRIDLRVTAE